MAGDLGPGVAAIVGDEEGVGGGAKGEALSGAINVEGRAIDEVLCMGTGLNNEIKLRIHRAFSIKSTTAVMATITLCCSRITLSPADQVRRTFVCGSPPGVRSLEMHADVTPKRAAAALRAVRSPELHNLHFSMGYYGTPQRGGRIKIKCFQKTC